MTKTTVILFGMFLIQLGTVILPLFSEIIFFAIAATVLLLVGFVIAVYGFFFFDRQK